MVLAGARPVSTILCECASRGLSDPCQALAVLMFFDILIPVAHAVRAGNFVCADTGAIVGKHSGVQLYTVGELR